MALRDIVPSTDEFIRKKSKLVENFDDKLCMLLDDMKETLLQAEGAGLSAVQVGVLKRVFITLVEDNYLEFINPRIVKSSGTQCNKEGCLSIKDTWGYVNRPKNVTIEAYDRKGKKFTLSCSGWQAIAVMHENDHLDGILYIDKVVNKE